MSDFNNTIIDQFRSNHGKVGEPFTGMDLLLLTVKGAKSGKEYTMPLAYTKYDDKYVIIASKGGAPTNPDWFYNLKANPEATVEVGDEKFKVRAEITGEEDRKKIYASHADKYPTFLEYQSKTDRSIPVILLERIS